MDLVIHEAGHVIFMPFKEFIASAGGTIMQIAAPLAFVAYFFRRRDFFSGSVVSFWLGQSLINISVYVADAQKMALPLLGGGIHDWNYMLGETSLLAFTPLIARFFFLLGLVVYCGALIMGLRVLSERRPYDA